MKLATAVPHPTVKGGYTVNDPMAPKGRALLFASKESAEIVADQRNKKRRNNEISR